MSSTFELSIVIPCYNEADNIPFIFDEIDKILSNNPYCEVVLVNNGSNDQSSKVFQEQLTKSSYKDHYKVKEVKENKGYGFGILSGLAEATGQVLAWTHADMQTDPADIISAYAEFKKHNNDMIFVKGNRQQRAFVPAFFTWGMGLLASTALKQNLSDVGAQPKLFSRLFYEKYLQTDAPYDFSLDLYAQYWAKRDGKIVEIPVVFKQRLHGEAKGGGSLQTRIKVTKRVASFIFEMRKSLKTKGLL
jgi:glycosyltransferase involved in cell wall biosynthesis